MQTPAQGLDGLLAGLAALVDREALTPANGTSLRAKLSAAAHQLERGNATAATEQLTAFAAEVEALVRADRLGAADAADLTALAERIVGSIAAR